MGALTLNHIAISDYLAGELVSPVKHEYLGGIVYAMAGGTNRHNAIASNILISLGSRLRGKPCRPFNSDTKVQVLFPTQTRFYYPDAMVVCRPSNERLSYQEAPVVIVEVLSRSTRRLDEGEKREAYFQLPSLQAYVLIDQECQRLTIWRRGDQGFQAEVQDGADASLDLPELGFSIPFNEIYEGVELGPEPEEEMNGFQPTINPSTSPS
jgi:Uma2 family endonuclease